MEKQISTQNSREERIAGLIRLLDSCLKGLEFARGVPEAESMYKRRIKDYASELKQIAGSDEHLIDLIRGYEQIVGAKC